MAKSKTRYSFEERPCERCGLNLVMITIRTPPPHGFVTPPLEGLCHDCYTPEEKKLYYSNCTGVLMQPN